MNDTSVAGTQPLSRFLKIAVIAGIESAIRIHIDRGDDLNARDRNGLTPLMLSAARNKPAICKLLLDAGADDGLLDPSGKTALAIAIAAGAHEAVAVLQSVQVPIGVSAPGLSAPPHSDGPIDPSCAQASEHPAHLIGASAIEADAARPAAPVEVDDAIEPENTPEFDLSGWEPEEDLPPPDADSSVAQAASAIQAVITEYKPVDSSADWDDIDAYLPETSQPLARADDTEALGRLRLLILRAVREGSVPRMAVEALSVNDNRSEHSETEAQLSMIINDLGAEVDERFEYASANATENFEVYVKPEESSDEEEIVANALSSIDSLVSNRTEPLRIYQKEFQRQRLISAEEEVALSRAMESALERALDALAAWPRGIELTLAAGHLVRTGQQPLGWLSLGPVDIQSELEPALEGENDIDTAAPDSPDEAAENDRGLRFETSPVGGQASDFLDVLDQLANLPVGSAQQGAGWRAIRETLSSLRLNRRFLLELAYIENDGDSSSANQFAAAMKAHQSAREQMAVANLKLVFHLAKKYLYSGEPLDDLAQEGNIGLLKAVERFDWRRGFKFSTYATWWIRQQIGRYLADKCRTVRVPVHVQEKVQRLSRETQAFEAETGRAPELYEIAARLNMAAHKVVELRRLTPEPLPIHELPIDELIAVEVRSDFVSPDPMDIVSNSEILVTIDKLLSTLKPKEEQILRLRFGIGVEEALTLDEIGCQYGVTRERVRQIEAAALRKLKHPRRMDAFARAVFGGPFYPEGKEEEESAEQPSEAKSMSRPAATETAPSSLSAPPPARSSGIDRLLAEVVDLAISVDDDRDGPSGRIWVNLANAPDRRYRKLVRKLLALGFEFWPGKGYWR
ncbi:sigma-70 family RNA polymerase sigma factor [Burkholderia multivorans]|uniref:sigma-70 family RNA polymerase sigma factor n=1 Tax=Burkholderia multivorans TaxID=87883 RepID=UPI0015E36362|nr:sigma-70 family RNA polymerase sigma factor [Burkholderia multivorans]